MRGKIRIVQIFLIIAFLTSCAAPDSSLQELDQPLKATGHIYTAEHIHTIIADAAPVLNTADENQSGFRIRASLLNDGIRFKIECVFDGEQKEKCVTYDSYDGVPVFIAASDQVLVYDPGSGVYLANPSGWKIKVEASDKSVNFSWRIQQKVNEGRILIDLRPIIQRFSLDRAVEQIDQNRYRYMARTPGGSRLKAIVSIDSKQLEDLYLKNKKGEEIIILQENVVGQTLPASAFGFPRIPDQLKTKPFPFPGDDVTGLLSNPEVIAEYVRFTYRLIFLREAIRRPAKREEVEEYLGEELDWVTLTNTDKKISAQLRSLSEH